MAASLTFNKPSASVQGGLAMSRMQKVETQGNMQENELMASQFTEQTQDALSNTIGTA